MKTIDDWLRIFKACGVQDKYAQAWAPIWAKVIQDGTFSKGDDELDDFAGQVLHESGDGVTGPLSKLEESLYYRTPGRLMAVWPSRFPTLTSELPYLRQPEKLAEKVYGGRMGNGPEGSGDGWRNRGSGLIQITGADNLKAVQAATGINVYDDPEQLRVPSEEALRVVIAWWEGNIPDAIMGNVKKVTKAVNGGQHGVDERGKLSAIVARELARV